jgi:NAD(P)-dependent dehydrogenase (short-subunit alcohol dehydrogenase family)
MAVRELRFTGRTAVVTGAGQGLGAVVAQAMAAEGATVVLAARSVASLERVRDEIGAAGGSAVVIPTDLRAEEAVRALGAEVNDRYGGADVVVNCSGIAGPTAPLWEQTPGEWDDTLRVNLTGAFLVCRAFLPRMIERGTGSIVVVGSMTGKRPLYGRTPYASSKMALVGLVRTLALETGPSGVRVNLVSPGPIAGPRLDAVLAAQAQALGISPEEARARLTGTAPLERVVEPAEVAAAALFLASDDASGITGEDLNVSAGIVSFG